MYLAGAWTAALMCCLAGTGGCRNRNESEPTLSPADSVRILRGVLAHRAEADSFFLHDPESPFVNDTSIRFHGIRWYPPDPGFVFHSLLTRAEPPETVTIAGTRGDLRREIRAGYFILSRGGREYRLNAYRSPQSQELELWFTDETTGNETYHVGRYLDAGPGRDDPGQMYELNFNNAYNPYCAYSSLYSCAVPRKEDHLPIRITAGELPYDRPR